MQFGHWTVIECTDKSAKRVKCVCGCGTVRDVKQYTLIHGKSRSCGCTRAEKLRVMGENSGTHNMTGTRLYRIWYTMKGRCCCKSNNRWDYYGGRGITLCVEWKEFEAFYKWAVDSGYSENVTIDRKDNEKGYFAENCRWVDKKTQTRNRSITLKIEYNGETRPLAEWAELYSMKYGMLYGRIYTYGWDVERALTTPAKSKAGTS